MDSDIKMNKGRTALLLMIITIVAKIIGFVREIIISYFFGASRETDVLYTASGFVTGVVFAMTASLSAAFIPTYIHTKKEGEKKFLWNSIFVFSIIGLVATLIFELFATPLAQFLAPTYNGENTSLLAEYIRYFSIGIIFAVLANIFLSTLNAESVFGYAAISGLIYSVITVVFVVFFNKSIGVKAIVFSVVFAYFIQSLVLFIRSRKYLFVGHFTKNSKKYVHSFIIASIPVLISNTTAEINHMVDRILANGLSDGAVSAMSYAHTLFNLVFQILCNTFITMAFTEIASYAVDNNKKGVEESVRNCVSAICLLVIPVSIVTAISGGDIVKIVFMRGKFDLNAANVTGKVLSIYSFSFLLAGLYMIFNKTYYAMDDYKIPTIYGIVSVVVNIILSIMGNYYFELDGIVWATVISNFLLTALLFLGLKRKGVHVITQEYIKEITTYAVSAIIMYIFLKLISVIVVNQNLYFRFIVLVLLGFIVFYGILLLLRNKRLISLFNMIKHRLTR